MVAESEISFSNDLDGSSLRIGILCTHWNYEHVSNLVEGINVSRRRAANLNQGGERAPYYHQCNRFLLSMSCFFLHPKIFNDAMPLRHYLSLSLDVQTKK